MHALFFSFFLLENNSTNTKPFQTQVLAPTPRLPACMHGRMNEALCAAPHITAPDPAHPRNNFPIVKKRGDSRLLLPLWTQDIYDEEYGRQPPEHHRNTALFKNTLRAKLHQRSRTTLLPTPQPDPTNRCWTAGRNALLHLRARGYSKNTREDTRSRPCVMHPTKQSSNKQTSKDRQTVLSPIRPSPHDISTRPPGHR